MVMELTLKNFQKQAYPVQSFSYNSECWLFSIIPISYRFECYWKAPTHLHNHLRIEAIHFPDSFSQSEDIQRQSPHPMRVQLSALVQLILPGVTTCDQVSQVFPLHIFMLEYWRQFDQFPVTAGFSLSYIDLMTLCQNFKALSIETTELSDSCQCIASNVDMSCLKVHQDQTCGHVCPPSTTVLRGWLPG